MARPPMLHAAPPLPLGDPEVHAKPYPAPVLPHDFSAEIPRGGYPYSRIQISPEGRYFAVSASTFGGQDTYTHVVVWDRQTDSSVVLDSGPRLGGALLHGHTIDNTGNYIVTGNFETRWIWHWPTDALSAPLSQGSPDFFAGHMILGSA